MTIELPFWKTFGVVMVATALFSWFVISAKLITLEGSSNDKSKRQKRRAWLTVILVLVVAGGMSRMYYNTEGIPGLSAAIGGQRAVLRI